MAAVTEVEVEVDTAGAVASTAAVDTPVDITVADTTLEEATTVVATPVACMVDHKLCRAAVAQG